MVSVTDVSRNREIVSVPHPTATLWRASSHRLVGDERRPDNDYIEATPGAVWSRWGPFEAYKPVLRRAREEEGSPHLLFAKLADKALDFGPPDEDARVFNHMVTIFANLYGLLGLFWEEFDDVPLLPERDVGGIVFVAPDAVMDGRGRLRALRPATEGKRLLEELFRERDRRIFAKRGEPHPSETEKYVLTQKTLILPEELRFMRRGANFVRTVSFHPDRGGVRTYDEVRHRYGLRFVFDRRSPTGVSIVSTREPVGAWRDELRSFGQPRSPGRVNKHLVGVNPREVGGKDSGPSWYCPSLLKALWLMRYVDLHGGTMIKKCQAPGCPSYFRVGPRGVRPGHRGVKGGDGQGPHPGGGARLPHAPLRPIGQARERPRPIRAPVRRPPEGHRHATARPTSPGSGPIER